MSEKRHTLWELRLRMPRGIDDVYLETILTIDPETEPEEIARLEQAEANRLAKCHIDSLASPAVRHVYLRRAVVATSEMYPLVPAVENPSARVRQERPNPPKQAEQKAAPPAPKAAKAEAPPPAPKPGPQPTGRAQRASEFTPNVSAGGAMPEGRVGS